MQIPGSEKEVGTLTGTIRDYVGGVMRAAPIEVVRVAQACVYIALARTLTSKSITWSSVLFH